MILGTESAKIWKHPMLWGLLAMFFAINVWSIFSFTGGYGKAGWEEMHRLSREKSWEASDIEYADELYQDLDMDAIREMKEVHTNYEPKGMFREFVNQCYRFFDGRVTEITSSKEAEGSYYPGLFLELHNFLYGELLSNVWLEMAVIVICSVLFLMDYERIAGTAELIYSSAKGRGLIFRKMLLGLCCGIVVGICLLGVTVLAFYCAVPMEGLWDTPVTAPLVANVRVVWLYPFITYVPMTVGEYLVTSLALGVLMILGVGILAGVVQLLVKSSFYGIMVLMILFLGGYVISGICTGTLADVFFRMSAPGLWSRSATWFMEWDLVMCFQGNEVLSLILQYLVYAVGLVAGICWWRKKDL